MAIGERNANFGKRIMFEREELDVIRFIVYTFPIITVYGYSPYNFARFSRRLPDDGSCWLDQVAMYH